MAVKTSKCPKCGSKELSKWVGAGEASIIYSCKYCGYKGPNVLEEFSR